MSGLSRFKIDDVPKAHENGGRIRLRRRWLGMWWTTYTARYGCYPTGGGIGWRSRDDAIDKADRRLESIMKPKNVIILFDGSAEMGSRSRR